MQKIGLVLSLAAIVGFVAILSGFPHNSPESNITQNLSTNDTRTHVTADIEIGLVTLSYIGDADIPLSNVTIIIEQGEPYSIYERLGQPDDKITKGDILTLSPDSVFLNGRILEAKISTNSSGVTGPKTSITIISGGDQVAKIISTDGFFS